MKEQPIPDTSLDQEDNTEDHAEDNHASQHGLNLDSTGESSQTRAQTSNCSAKDNENELEYFPSENCSGSIAGDAETQNENSTENLESNIKSELLWEPCISNRGELMDIINSECIEIEDDMIIRVGPKGYGKPFNMTSSCLIKRENDILTGDTPFNTSVSALIHLAIIFFSL